MSTKTLAPSIIIVDDDAKLRDALKLLFEHDGFEVIGQAADGAEAMTLAVYYQPDFIILDYAMPELDGMHTSIVLRKLAPQAKIVAFSAYLEAKPNWADAYLSKDRIVEMSSLIKAMADL